MARVESILDVIGRTPVVRIKKLAPEGMNLYAKLESANPMGSVKDRLALGIIEDAEQSGALAPGQTVIEATSGNTGIGLAMVCAEKGYPLVVTMAENFSVERRKILRFLGAKVILTPGSQRGTGMLAKAVELAAAHGWFLCHQFSNEANANTHSQTTALEILEDFADDPLDYWVTGFGTGGTLKGVARVLKERSPGTQIMVCEPDNSQILGSGIPQAFAPDGSFDGSHPSFRPHMMQGWSGDFIPKLTQDAVSSKMVDGLLAVNGAEALKMSRELARKEGIFAGISGGATLAGALQVCATARPGSNILFMLPDTGERYLTTPLFADVPVDMSEEEVEISTSTPNFRFDVPSAPPTPRAAEAPVPVTPAAQAFLAETIADPTQPVVMFALTWCEFCWSVRKFLTHCKIPYRDIDLDSVENQVDDWGGKLRAALVERTSFNTIPQVFVGGKFMGGCTEVFDAFKDGSLEKALQGSNVQWESDVKVDPYTFLPTWLHPR
jgi:cysteine synthase A